MRDKKIGILFLFATIYMFIGLLLYPSLETLLIKKNFKFTEGIIFKNDCEGKNKTSMYMFKVKNKLYFNLIPYCLELKSKVNVAYDSTDININKLMKVKKSYYFYKKNKFLVKNKSNYTIEWVY